MSGVFFFSVLFLLLPFFKNLFFFSFFLSFLFFFCQCLKVLPCFHANSRKHFFYLRYQVFFLASEMRSLLFCFICQSSLVTLSRHEISIFRWCTSVQTSFCTHLGLAVLWCQQSYRFVGYSLMSGVYTAHYEYRMTPRIIGLCDKTASQSWKDDVVVTVWCLVFLFFLSLRNNFENFASQTQVAMVRQLFTLSKMTETVQPCCVTNEGARVAYILGLFRLLKGIGYHVCEGCSVS